MNAEEFNRLIMDCWESISFVAFDGFQRMGRGVVALMEDRLPLDQSYFVYGERETDPRTARLIAEYDPAWEVLVQYMRSEGSVITLRIRTSPGQRHPWQVWMYNKDRE